MIQSGKCVKVSTWKGDGKAALVLRIRAAGMERKPWAGGGGEREGGGRGKGREPNGKAM